MILTKLHLITVITERLLRDDIIEKMLELGAKGYTLTDATGTGSRGIRASDWEGKNVKIESVVSKEVADKIIAFISKEYFENYAVITYTHPVKVVRGGKYV